LHWFRAVFKFYNSMLGFNCATMRKVLKSDVYLGSVDTPCWPAQVHEAFGGLRGADVYRQSMSRASKIPMQELFLVV